MAPANGIWLFSWAVIIALGLAVIAHVVLFHTRFGVHVLAIGGSAESSRSLGIWVWMVRTGDDVIAATHRRRGRRTRRTTWSRFNQ